LAPPQTLNLGLSSSKKEKETPKDTLMFKWENRGLKTFREVRELQTGAE
jgi:hypothetical protein